MLSLQQPNGIQQSFCSRVLSPRRALLTLALLAALAQRPPAAAQQSQPRDGADSWLVAAVTGQLKQPAPEYRGLAIQLTFGNNVDDYAPLIDEVAALGANTVMLCPRGRMEHARSQAIFVDARETPSAADLTRLIEHAKTRKLRVIVMPILLLKHPRGSEWRGVIDPPNWKEWWRQYRDFVIYFADVAQAGGADALLVGSELVSTEKYESEWRQTIEQVRSRFHGQLGYSANWDHYEPIKFWDALDLVGMTSYYTLAKRQGPSVEELEKSWRPIREKITRWQRGINKPIVFTEVGWCSQAGAAARPWDYYQNMKATPEGHEEQRRLYEAFVNVWDGTPGVTGVIWWDWTPAAGGPDDYNYTPRGKPAEQVLRAWFAKTQRGGASESDSQTPATD